MSKQDVLKAIIDVISDAVDKLNRLSDLQAQVLHANFVLTTITGMCYGALA